MFAGEVAQLADPPGAQLLLRFQIMRLEMRAIGDAELLARLVGGGDHAFAFGDAQRHGLFAEHVLARF